MAIITIYCIADAFGRHIDGDELLSMPALIFAAITFSLRYLRHLIYADAIAFTCLPLSRRLMPPPLSRFTLPDMFRRL